VVEKGRRVGGVSVHTGTIPSKTCAKPCSTCPAGASAASTARSYRVKQDIGANDLIARCTRRSTMRSRCWSISSAAIRSRPPAARPLVGPHQVEVTDEAGEAHRTAKNILIACGTRPFRPDYVPFDGKTVFDSDEIIDLPKLPRSLAVIGAGVIGVEYATIFSALDVAVTLIDRGRPFLDFIDKELIDEFMHELRDRNVALRLGSKVNRSSAARAAASTTKLSDGRNVTTEMLLFAAGRVGATDRLNLGAPGSRSIIAAASRSIR
jgi:NAD(P) transhydrogenase